MPAPSIRPAQYIRPAEDSAHRLARRFEQVRAQTVALTAPLSAEDCQLQSMPDASPVKWHLAHLGWFFETFVLERFEKDFKPFDASFRVLFNSYYNGVGDKYPRPKRGLISRPTLHEVLAYRAEVDERILTVLARHPHDGELDKLVTPGLPTEFEWEFAAHSAAAQGNFVETAAYHPIPQQQEHAGPAQMFGDVWEWTQSNYNPYPGYKPWEGVVGEYNGKFMCNQFVLRGGSCVTPRSHIRASYRNFFPPDAQWQFSGLRLARDIA